MVGSPIQLLMLTKAWLVLPAVETWKEVEETYREDGNYEKDTECDSELPLALESEIVGRSFV